MAAHIVSVDDDPVVQRLIEINLEMEGYTVALASNGEDGLALIREVRPALVLLDVTMRRMDGWAVRERMLEEPDLADIPVVFLTARAQDADIERGKRLGAAAYVTKPFDPIDLVELVADLVRGGL